MQAAWTPCSPSAPQPVLLQMARSPAAGTPLAQHRCSCLQQGWLCPFQVSLCGSDARVEEWPHFYFIKVTSVKYHTNN